MESGSGSTEFRDARRILNGLLSSHEKRALVWLATRLPSRVSSDHLTALGLGAMLLVGFSFWAARAYPIALLGVVLGLAINWFGDSLDGTVARVRRCERPRYGYYVDHICDMFGALFLFGGMALSGYATPAIAIGLLIAYLMISIEVFLAAHVLGEFRITYLAFGPTELRILLAMGALTLLVKPYVVITGRTFLLLDVAGVIAIVAMGAVLIQTSVGHSRRLARMEG